MNTAGRGASQASPDMDNADSVPKEVWEALDQATTSPVYFLLVLGVGGLIGGLVVVSYLVESRPSIATSIAIKCSNADRTSTSFTFSYPYSLRSHDRPDNPRNDTLL